MWLNAFQCGVVALCRQSVVQVARQARIYPALLTRNRSTTLKVIDCDIRAILSDLIATLGASTGTLT
jgi:hypothetical protein